MISITLNDGSKLDNLSVDGSYFVSKNAIDFDTLPAKLSPLTISQTFSDENQSGPISPIIPGTYKFVRLMHYIIENGTYQFTLKILTEQEAHELKTDANIAYISMMSDIDLPD